jgi:hypothetical protein
MKNLAVALLCLSLILPHPALMAPVTAQPTNETLLDDIEGRLAFFDELIDQLEDIRANINRGSFELDALVESVDFDAEALIEFVTQEIAFQPYVGALRGAKGTLAGGAGNALDQSILLANLLKDAGYDARIVRSRLTPVQAELLLTNAQPDSYKFESVFSTTPAVLADSFNDVLAQLNSKSWLNPVIQEEISDVANSLIQLLEANAIELGDPAFHEGITHEAMDYFAVDYREGPATPWRMVHPAFGGADIEIDRNAQLAVYDGKVPEELLHRVSFQAFVEKRLGSAVVKESIMSAWEIPTANLYKQELVFSLIPENLGSIISDIRERVDRSTDPDLNEAFERITETFSLESDAVFIPLFNNELAPGAKLFDLRGNVLPADVPLTMAGVFKNIGGSFGEAVSALDAFSGGRSGTKEKAMALERVWVEYKVTSPSGHGEVFSRNLFLNPHRLGLDMAGENESYNFTQSIAFMVATGRPNPAYLLDRNLAHLIGLRSAIQEALVLLSEDNLLGAEELLVREGALSAELDVLKLFYAFDSWVPSDKTGSYRDSPSIVALENGVSISAETRFFMSVDIVRNERKVIGVKEGQPVLAPKEAVGYGVWETFVEKEFMAARIAGLESVMVDHESWSAFSFLTSEETSVRDAMIFSSADEIDWSILSARPEVIAGLEEEFARGGLVVLVGDGLEERVNGWWRVSPESGSVLGVAADGRGNVVVKYLTILSSGIKSTFMTQKFVEAFIFLLWCSGAAKIVADVKERDANITSCLVTFLMLQKWPLTVGTLTGVLISNFILIIFGPLMI